MTVLIETLEHDGERAPVGSTLELEPEQAQQLLDVGAVRATGSEPGANAEKGSKPKPAKKQQAKKQ